MKKKSLKDRLLSLSIISSILIGIASSFVVTYAAIINKFVANNDLQYNVSGYSAYFGGGSGAEGNPFIINNSEHLRNLQKLNSLGVFNENTYFQLGQSFTYKDDPLLPIGTDDVPFNSQFDGKGYTITDLVVNGANTRDVGMFGYVGINGKVSNMILNHPTINLTANTAGDYNSTANGALSTTNYLDSVLNSANNPAAKGLSNPTYSKNGTETLTFTSTSITDSNGIIYTINYSSSSSLIYNTVESNNIFTVRPTGDASLFTNDQTLVHITASVQATFGGNIINYTLERFAVTLKRDASNGNVSIYRTNGNPLIEKTMWFEGTDASGNSYTDYHETYIGFFIGHCDGGASYLGLYGGTSSDKTVNATLNISGRVVKSYGVLVGKSRTDNPRDVTAINSLHKNFNFAKIKSDPKIQYNLITGPTEFASDSTNSSSNDTKTYIDNTNSQAIKLTKAIETNINGTTNPTDLENLTKYLKFYPSGEINTNSGNTPTDYKDGILKWRGATSNGTYSAFNYGTSILNTKYYHSDNISSSFGENCLWLWATQEFAKSNDISTIISDALFKEGGTFYVTYKISYIPRNLGTGNYFRVFYNGYCDNRYATYIKVTWTGTKEEKVFLPVTRYAHWKPLDSILVAEYTHKDYPVLYSEDSNGNVIENENLNDQIIEQTIQVKIDTSDLEKWGLKTTTLIGNQNAYTPSLMLGLANSSDPTSKGQQKVNSYNVSGVSSSYSFESGCITTTDSNGKEVIDFETSKRTYFFKDEYSINKLDNTKEAGIDIIDFDVTFTTSDGNSGSLFNNVDYLYTNATYEYDKTNNIYKWTNWSNDSGVKVYFDVNKVVDGNSPVTYSFWRTSGYGSNHANSKVNGTYSNSTYPLNNTNGFKEATLAYLG